MSFFAKMHPFLLAAAAAVVARLVASTTVVGYYSHSCPEAEKIVSQVVAEQFTTRPLIAAGILRLYFHDCFVEGCDGSILLDASPDGTPPEKLSLANNNSATGFELIDVAKRRIEAVCPSTVSCADILALAARDSVAISGGPRWDEPTGRYDGRVSLASNANADIPGPSFNLSRLLRAFANKTLDARDLVTLSGGHTIGRSHCTSFQSRLYNFSGTGRPDPALSPAYATILRRICPNTTSTPRRVTVALDRGGDVPFDNSYFVQLLTGNGLLTSDEELLLNGSMRGLVSVFAANQQLFFREFAKAMVKLGKIGVKDSSQGEVRLHCRRNNGRRGSRTSPPPPPAPIMHPEAPPPPY